MSTLTGISSYSSAASYLFSKIDSSNKGYIEKEDLVSAFSTLSTGDTNAEDVFTQLDNDSDGKITESEFSTALENLAETLNGQYDQSRMSNMMPPPPPPAGESNSGFSEEELNNQLEEIGDTDSARSTLISSILENFDAADTDSDGTVSNTEAMAYAEANDLTSPASASATATSTSSATGFTADELSAQLEEIGSADPVRSSLISSVVENFDAADTNQDGVVSNTEAMAYAEANNITANETASSSTSSDGSDSALSDAQVYRQIMELMHAYGGDGNNSFLTSLASSISTNA